MRLASYRFEDSIGVAAVEEELVVDCRPFAGASMRAFLAQGQEALAGLRAFAATAVTQLLDNERLLPPVPDPALFIGVGLNYRKHAAEMGRELPRSPALFTKAPASINTPHGLILRDPAAPSLDYEGELGIVIGRTCRKVPEASAAEVIAGYVVVNDVTVRERITPDAVMLAKGGDTHGPFGPWITTADEIPDPHDLGIRTWVNGEVRQDGSTADLHFGCFELVARISAALTLRPGDIITTGSPAGSGSGFQPPRWLEPGDVVRVEIDRIGAIEHVVRDLGDES
jgi:2-keto-4-pentenoate hydratase/2-oxohepta-3-ene-1,7-dioic acid hydratase in catechol pathway